MEKSNNCNIDTIVVNGNTATLGVDGKYRIGVKNSTEILDIIATAEDKYAKTTIQGQANDSYIAKTKETVVDRKNYI